MFPDFLAAEFETFPVILPRMQIPN